jgi:hypothetical protein
MTRPVEADEPFVGGKARNMYVGERIESVRRRGGADQAIVFRLLERETGTSARLR